MTTIAYDGSYMAADTLATDMWGAKEFVKDKIWVGDKVLLGCAGSTIVKSHRTAIAGLSQQLTGSMH